MPEPGVDGVGDEPGVVFLFEGKERIVDRRVSDADGSGADGGVVIEPLLGGGGNGGVILSMLPDFACDEVSEDVGTVAKVTQVEIGEPELGD